MKRTALLRTRCGCEKYMEIDHDRSWIELPLRIDRPSDVNKQTVDMTKLFRRRRFRFDGRTADGIFIYTEVLE